MKDDPSNLIYNGNINFVGVWDAFTKYTYDVTALVPLTQYKGKFYIAIAMPTQGKTPDTAPAEWSVMGGNPTVAIAWGGIIGHIKDQTDLETRLMNLENQFKIKSQPAASKQSFITGIYDSSPMITQLQNYYNAGILSTLNTPIGSGTKNYKIASNLGMDFNFIGNNQTPSQNFLVIIKAKSTKPCTVMLGSEYPTKKVYASASFPATSKYIYFSFIGSDISFPTDGSNISALATGDGAKITVAEFYFFANDSNIYNPSN